MKKIETLVPSLYRQERNMKKLSLFGVPILVFLVLAVLVGVVAADNTTVTLRPVIAFGGPDGIEPGSDAHATLKRGADGAKFNIHTSNLIPGDAYTVWWVIWNAPENCENGCGEDDVGRPGTGSSAFWATGKVIPDSTNGVANFQAKLDAGPDGPLGEVLVPGGLTNVAGAEIHLVIQGHGQATPETEYFLTHYFMAGWPCGTCGDHQAVVFQP
jgi:hypothetical protein